MKKSELEKFLSNKYPHMNHNLDGELKLSDDPEEEEEEVGKDTFVKTNNKTLIQKTKMQMTRETNHLWMYLLKRRRTIQMDLLGSVYL